MWKVRVFFREVLPDERAPFPEHTSGGGPPPAQHGTAHAAAPRSIGFWRSTGEVASQGKHRARDCPDSTGAKREDKRRHWQRVQLEARHSRGRRAATSTPRPSRAHPGAPAHSRTSDLRMHEPERRIHLARSHHHSGRPSPVLVCLIDSRTNTLQQSKHTRAVSPQRRCVSC